MIEPQKAFSQSIEKDLESLINSCQNTFEFDKRLFNSELTINYAYCDALFEAGVLTRLESEKIKNGLQTLSKRSEFDKDYFKGHKFNSISEFIEHKLIQLVGNIGRKINIGRSSKDLKQTVLRFWIRNKLSTISEDIREVQFSFVSLAENNRKLIQIKKINTKQNQPIVFAQWCLRYVEIFNRDRERIDEVWRRTNIMPLGVKDGNSSIFEIDREELSRRLNFEGIPANNLDAIKDTDFYLEFINAAILINLHIKQLAADLINFSSDKNPFIVFANKSYNSAISFINGCCSILQGFQVTLNSTFSESMIDSFNSNKIIVETADILVVNLKIIVLMLKNLTINNSENNELIKEIFINRTEIFEYLIQRGLSYETADSTTNKIVHYLSSLNFTEDISIEKLIQISEVVNADILEILDISKNLEQKDQIGGSSSERISQAIEEARTKLNLEQ